MKKEPDMDAPTPDALRASLRRLYRTHRILTEQEAEFLCAAMGIPEGEVLEL